MSDLLAELERAEQGSRELDAPIWWQRDKRSASIIYWNASLGKPSDLPDNWHDVPRGLGILAVKQNAPHYTTSLDSALTLVPEGCAWQVTQRLDNLGPTASIQRRGKNGLFDIWKDVEAATPALALCIASLKAIQALKEKAGG